MSERFVPRSDHERSLQEGYAEVANRTWASDDFVEENLEGSRGLYTPQSLEIGTPRPRPLEVYALLSGLPFAGSFARALEDVQRDIDDAIGPRLRYWVSPANFGVEYLVFKWPDDAWKPEWMEPARDAVTAAAPRSFEFVIGGVQVNPDGCVVARGYDAGGELFRIREAVRSALPWIPTRQSGWAHVPLGRILEPVGSDAFARLRKLMSELNDRKVTATTLDRLVLVHETRWYMEERAAEHEWVLGSA